MQKLIYWGNIAILYNILNAILLFVLSVVFAYIFIFVNLKTMAILQQNHYCNLPTIKWCFSFKNKPNNWFYLFVDLLAFCVVTQFFVYFNLQFYFYYILVVALVCYLFCFGVKSNLTKLKKGLVTTPRIKRLMVTSFIVGFLVCYALLLLSLFLNIYWLYGLLILSVINSAIILVCNLINKPIEKLINYSYVLKAKKKLKDYSNLIVVAITGSFGKTSTKNFLETMLKSKFNVLSSPMSYNTPMGVTKTILEHLKPYHQVLILEFGADHKNDIKKLCKIVSPNVSVVTAVGEQHLKTFKTLNNIIKTKHQIVLGTKQNGFFVTNLSNSVCNNYFKASPVKAYGVLPEVNDNKNGAFCRLTNLTTSRQGIKITGVINNEPFTLKTKLLGKFNAVNLMLALTVAYNLGVPLQDIESSSKNIVPVKHRLELKTLANGAILIDDSFNSNPVGAKCAVETLKLLSNKTTIITCGMVELGDRQFKENFNFGTLLKGVTNVLIVNQINYKAISSGLKSVGGKEPKVFNSFLDAYSYAVKLSDGESAILIENDLTDSYIC